jgi:hypothetical protein
MWLSKMAPAVTLQTCVWEVSNLNLNQDTDYSDYPDLSFLWFPSVPAKLGHNRFFPHHFHFII